MLLFMPRLIPGLPLRPLPGAFIFLNNKNYWLINIACAVIIAVAFVLIHKGGLGAFGILSKAVAFIYIVYILNYIRLIIGKQ